MSRWLFVFFIVVPALEVLTFIKIGQLIGGWQTFFCVLLSGFIGIYICKLEARKVWGTARRLMAQGQIPGKEILDGICLFAGGILLITPGFLTDILGLFLILPATRILFRRWLQLYITAKIAKGQTRIFTRRS